MFTALTSYELKTCVFRLQVTILGLSSDWNSFTWAYNLYDISMVPKRFPWELCNWGLIHVKHRLYWHGPSFTSCFTNEVKKVTVILRYHLEWNGFPFLYIFDIQNHRNRDFLFWPLDGAKDQKFIYHHSRDGLFSRPTKFHPSAMFLSGIKIFQWSVWEPYI